MPTAIQGRLSSGKHSSMMSSVIAGLRVNPAMSAVVTTVTHSAAFAPNAAAMPNPTLTPQKMRGEEGPAAPAEVEAERDEREFHEARREQDGRRRARPREREVGRLLRAGEQHVRQQQRDAAERDAAQERLEHGMRREHAGQAARDVHEAPVEHGQRVARRRKGHAPGER